MRRYPSPCAATQSLLDALETQSCPRAVYAGRAALAWAHAGASDDDAGRSYARRFLHPQRSFCPPSDPPVVASDSPRITICVSFDPSSRFAFADRLTANMITHILPRHPGQIAVFYKSYPHLTALTEATSAALFAAGEQGRFFELLRPLSAPRAVRSLEDLDRAAAAVGLDLARWRAALPAARERVHHDWDEARTLRAHGADDSVVGLLPFAPDPPGYRWFREEAY